jgi:hypothetical protein
LLSPVLLQVQNTSCSVAGTIEDSAGAVMPGTKVTLTGESNGFVRTPATFTLSIDAKGFTTYHQTLHNR